MTGNGDIISEMCEYHRARARLKGYPRSVEAFQMADA